MQREITLTWGFIKNFQGVKYMHEEYYLNKTNISKECFLLPNSFASTKTHLNITLSDVTPEIDKFTLYGSKIHKIVGLDIYDSVWSLSCNTDF